jgi:conjugative transfer signal peptidase TraF
MTPGLFSNWRDRPARAGKLLVMGAGILLGTLQTFDLAGLRINTSPSLPVGLYLTTSDPAANLVEFCPNPVFGKLALDRGYRSAGSCRDGGAPLLKPVVAKSGDVVEISETGLSVNGRAIPNTAPMAADIKGRLLASWPLGRYVVARGDVWTASSFNRRSFDSRYFGPVPMAAIRDRVRPLVTFGK